MTSPVHHETSDVDVTAVFGFGLGLTILAVVISVVVWGVFVYFSDRAVGRGAISDRRTATQETRLPPEPRLQTNPRGDLGALREAEDRALTTYGWVDRKTGVVRIPIEQAMTLTAERGLPSRAAKEPAR